MGLQSQKAAGFFLIGAGVGIVSGYLYAEHSLKGAYEALASDEVAAAREYYSRLNKKNDYETPAKAVEKIIPQVVTNALREYAPSEETPSEIVVSIFDNDADADEEVDMESRSKDRPYILTREEYMLSEPDYTQTTVTYFEADEVLADERDAPIENAEKKIGLENLRFGSGSGDPNLVYIRNDALEIDFEVIRSRGAFTHEVLGFETEIKHSAHKPGLRKFRESFD